MSTAPNVLSTGTSTGAHFFEHRFLVAPLTGVPGRIPARKASICDFFALSSGLYARYIFPKVEGPAGPSLYGRHGQVKLPALYIPLPSGHLTL